MRAIKLRRVCSSGFFCAGRAHGIFRPRTRTFRHPRTRHTCIMHTQREVRAKVRTSSVCKRAAYRCHNFTSFLCLHHISAAKSTLAAVGFACRACLSAGRDHVSMVSRISMVFNGARARVRRIVGFSILCKLSRGIAKADGPPSTSEGKREISQAVIRPASIVARVTMWWRTFVIPCRTIKC